MKPNPITRISPESKKILIRLSKKRKQDQQVIADEAIAELAKKEKGK